MRHAQPLPDFEQLVVFHGELNAHKARVYMRLDVSGPCGAANLSGRVHGPLSLLTRTLPASISFRDRGQGSSLLAEAILPDPCSWLPGQPYLYEVSAQLLVNQQLVAERSFVLGMRSCGVHAGRLLLEGRPWMLWGAAEERIESSDWAQWRDASLARLVRNPSDDCCEQASREGVMLIAELDLPLMADAGSRISRFDALLPEVRRLSRHASVAIVAIGAEMLDPADAVRHIRSLAPNLLWGHRLAMGRESETASWADVLICEPNQLPLLAGHPDIARQAVLVQQADNRVISLPEAHDKCRRLSGQRSPIVCVAGWLV